MRDVFDLFVLRPGTVVSDNLVNYYERPTPLNDVHGIGTVLLAGSEMLATMKDPSP